MFDKFSILPVLANKGFYSGEQIAKKLGVTRATINNAIKMLSKAGLKIDSVPGRGYRLRQEIELLKKKPILDNMSRKVREKISHIEVFNEIISTNSYLMQGGANFASGYVCIAEHQMDGRGRGGKSWYSPYGVNLYLSYLHHFRTTAFDFSCFSLWVGISLVENLSLHGYSGVQLKWPNDLVYENKKLGGILIDVSGEVGGSNKTAIGVGLNVNMDSFGNKQIDQEWTSLARMHPDLKISRNTAAAAVIQSIYLAIEKYENSGTQGLSEAWEKYDALREKEVMVATPTQKMQAQVEGIDQLGRLKVNVKGEKYVFSAADVTILRAQQ